ncbi:D-erythronate dehydrogenase [Larsenimonas rhizosphaerae]|uniref:D-erythronate dehydrogenase n=1 Tax=Larsenimonas rhizosphaerae TaxID=2944682 RepID=UPI002034A62A|nr:D-erythronate dehydrogenase [Larsenimonas rhizosphaerae]MCM2129449.1 SDR family oxidoreductase [Larsenimonas rhizosphaerae]
MHVMITGAAGFLGQRLVHQLIERGALKGQALTRLTLLDHVKTAPPDTDVPVDIHTGDLADPAVIQACLAGRPAVIYHLAAVVSSAAEADLALGMQVNFDATRQLLEGCAALSLSDTRLIMAGSVAAYGGALPDTVTDMTALVPQNSYGTQKAMAELLINDYSRRGLIDGLVLRLPTIIVRSGRPNAAASSFASSLLREPFKGEVAVCPVPESLEMFVMSPGCVVAALLHGADVPASALSHSRGFMLPGITISVAQMLDTLEALGGPEASALVRHEPDPRIEAIVGSWPARFSTDRARALGFAGDTDLTAIVQAFLTDDATVASA